MVTKQEAALDVAYDLKRQGKEEEADFWFEIAAEEAKKDSGNHQ